MLSESHARVIQSIERAGDFLIVLHRVFREDQILPLKRRDGSRIELRFAPFGDARRYQAGRRDASAQQICEPSAAIATAHHLFAGLESSWWNQPHDAPPNEQQSREHQRGDGPFLMVTPDQGRKIWVL